MNKDRGIIVISDTAGPAAVSSLGSMSKLLLDNQSLLFKTLGTGVCERLCECVKGGKVLLSLIL